MADMTKEQLEARVAELESVVEKQQAELRRLLGEKYEMLTRIYPYMANELDSLRGQMK